ncbi:hypothetical protein T492DRAFT_375206 [Pavlovales sp. CCMP2436]|nr:hypothetical protein T492DRAFT_375206 [Pavlovales sp. CCMP2436]
MVATPGRLLEHLTGTNGFAARLATVETLVLDEVDQLLDGGFQRDIERIISALRPSSDDGKVCVKKKKKRTSDAAGSAAWRSPDARFLRHRP